MKEAESAYPYALAVLIATRGIIPRICLFVAVTVGPEAVRAAPPKGYETAASDQVVAGLIDQLGASSFEVRTAATQQLLAMGSRAVAALGEAESGDDFEAAVRARQLLAVFSELLFSGVAIELEASRISIGWTDSVELVVHLHNPTAQVARIPFETAVPPAGTRPPHVHQVTASLDLADFLEVVGPDKERVELHVDDITQDERVRAAVDDRAANPRTSDLPPGGTVTLRIPGLNRGWARYRLLRGGVYKIRLVYQPAWSDEELIRSGVGGAASNEIRITVTDPAPPDVRDVATPASLHLERSGEHTVAYLTNHSDFPLYVNLNIAQLEPLPFARLRWYQSCDGERTEIRRPTTSFEGIAVFRRDRVKEIDPGGRIELGRLETALAATSSGGATGCGLSVSYSSVVGRGWQRIQAAGMLGNPRAPEALRTLLPRRMLTTMLTSPPLTADPSE